MTSTAVVAVSFDEMSRLAEAVAKSGLFGMKTPDQALALMAISAAEGMHPALAARDYHVIQGRPVLKSDAMLARFQAAGGRMKMVEYTDSRVSAEFSHPQGGTVVVDWDTERAKRAGLGGKDNWKNYPRQMLRARVISEGIRTVFPGATQGLLTPEEAADIPQIEGEKDVTPAKPVAGVVGLQARIAALKTEEPRVADTAALMTEDAIVEFEEAFDKATSVDVLKAAWESAKSITSQLGDTEAATRMHKRVTVNRERLRGASAA